MVEMFYAAALLACPLGMGLMMWFMMRGHRQQSPPQLIQDPAQGAGDAELARLRTEVDELRAAQRAAAAAPVAGAPGAVGSDRTGRG